ncbi:amidohydrolase [Catenulispora rubra]|uniref:amidohydrolase n=1 Tax=Catenulispora rubra TaxID=280293 RepID=UPI0018921082|nr:amidohydrolase family protein [Catenulispora rubra]
MESSKQPKHNVSRRALLRTSATAGAAAAAAGSIAAAGPAAATASASTAARRSTSPAGNLILRNGRIHTMDSAGTVAGVIAIQGGVITYVGNSFHRARRSFAEDPRVIDLHGRIAMPGLIDCHNHFVLMGNRPGRHTPLENAYSIADVLALYRRRAAALPANNKRAAGASDFITTIGGFTPNQFAEKRLPTLAELDDAVPDRPVYIQVGFTGPAVTNSLGKTFFENVSGPFGPVQVGADGSIAGAPFPGSGPSTKALLALRRTLTFDDRKSSVRDAMAYAASLGVTTHLDQGAFQATNTPDDGAASEDNFAMYNPFLAVYGEGNQRDAVTGGLPEAVVRLRTNALLFDSEPDIPVAKARLQNTFPFFGNDLVRTGAIGEFLADFQHYAGGNDTWTNAATAVAKAGWRAEVHSITPSDFRTEIEGFEAVNSQTSIEHLRWVVAHATFITPDYVARLKALGGGVNVTPYRYFGTAVPAGPPYRMLADSGIPLGLSSDGMQIAPLNPWIHAYYATTGLNALGNQVNPGQQLTRAEVLAGFTTSNQWFLGGEDEHLLGSLETGRLGDVVVLSDDYFTVPDSQLRSLHSVLTVVGGSVVHSGDIRYWVADAGSGAEAGHRDGGPGVVGH